MIPRYRSVFVTLETFKPQRPNYYSRNEGDLFVQLRKSPFFGKPEPSIDDVIKVVYDDAQKFEQINKKRTDDLIAADKLSYQLELDRLRAEGVSNRPAFVNFSKRIRDLERIIRELNGDNSNVPPVSVAFPEDFMSPRSRTPSRAPTQTTAPMGEETDVEAAEVAAATEAAEAVEVDSASERRRARRPRPERLRRTPTLNNAPENVKNNPAKMELWQTVIALTDEQRIARYGERPLPIGYKYKQPIAGIKGTNRTDGVAVGIRGKLKRGKAVSQQEARWLADYNMLVQGGERPKKGNVSSSPSSSSSEPPDKSTARGSGG